MARRLSERELFAKLPNPPVLPDKFTGLVKGPSYKYSANRKGVYCMQFAPDGSYLAVGYTDGTVEALDVTHSEAKYVKDLKMKKYGNDAATCIRFHPRDSNHAYVSTAGGKVERCNFQTGSNEIAVEEEGNHIQALDFDNRGKTFCTGGTDLNVRLYDANTHKEIRCMEGFQVLKSAQSDGSHSQRIFAIKYHPTDYDVIVSGGWENNIKIWDLRRANPIVTTLTGPHICGDTLDFQGTEILAGSWSLDGGIQLWDYTYRELIKKVPLRHTTKNNKGEGDYIYCCQFCDNDVILAGGSGTGSVQAVNKNTDEFLGEIFMSEQHPVQALDVTLGGTKVAFGGTGEVLRTGKLH